MAEIKAHHLQMLSVIEAVILSILEMLARETVDSVKTGVAVSSEEVWWGALTRGE